MNAFEPHYCIAPVTFYSFVADHWGQQPLFVPRNDANYFAGLFSVADFDAYLHLARYDREPNSILIANQQRRPHADKVNGRDGFLAPHLVLRAYSDGDSIVLNRMERFWPSLTQMARAWELAFRCRVTLHSYLTPSNAQGFPPHYEGVEVCVLQLHGSKTWKIYPPLMQSPLHSREVSREEIGAPLLEVTLHAGDFLYLPRGFVHEGVSSSEGSLHVSALIHVITWRDVLASAAERLADGDPRLRQSLPPGALFDSTSTDALASAFDTLAQDLAPYDARGALQALERKVLLEQQSLPADRFGALDRIPSIKAESTLFRHSGALCSVSVDGSKAQLTFSGNFLRAPLSAQPLFEFVTQHERFAVAEVPDVMTEHDRLVLLRRLVREGLLGIE